MLSAGVSEPESKWIKIYVRFQRLEIRLLNSNIRPYHKTGQEHEAHQKVALAPTAKGLSIQGMKCFTCDFKTHYSGSFLKLNGYARKACSASTFAVIRVTRVLGNWWVYLGS